MVIHFPQITAKRLAVLLYCCVAEEIFKSFTHSNLHILTLIYLLPLFPPLSCVGIVSDRFVELANEKIGVFKQ